MKMKGLTGRTRSFSQKRAKMGVVLGKSGRGLSLLKDGKMYGQLRRSFYENVCAYFEAKEGAAGIIYSHTITLVPICDTVLLLKNWH